MGYFLPLFPGNQSGQTRQNSQKNGQDPSIYNWKLCFLYFLITLVDSRLIFSGVKMKKVIYS